MKTLMKFLLICGVTILSACSSKNTPTRLSESELDHKSYAIAYSVTGQTYKDRVTPTYDINAFTQGVDDWYYNRISLPIEQIQAMTLNRLVDHKEYAYYSGVMFADAFKRNVDYLDKNCWGLLHKPSMVQAMDDAMHDLQKGKVRDDQYIREGADKIIQLCVKTIVYDEKTEVKTKTATKKSVKKAKNSK